MPSEVLQNIENERKKLHRIVDRQDGSIKLKILMKKRNRRKSVTISLELTLHQPERKQNTKFFKASM